MAQKTLEKNSLMKFFEIFKDKFFKIILLNIIFTTYLIILIIAVFAINRLAFICFGEFSNVWSLLTFSPMILVGPITAAITKLCRDFVREEPGFFAEDLKKAFKENFKQSILISLMQYIVVWAIYIAFGFYYRNLDQGTFFTIGLGVTIFVAIAFVFAGYYFYMMTVTLKLKFKEIIKNSFIFTMLCFGRNLLLTLVMAIWIGLVGSFVYLTIISANAFLYGLSIIILMVLFFGIIFYTVAFFTFPPIKKHILDPYYEQHPLETSKSISEKVSSVDIDYNGLEENNDIPEFVYHNGKMIHRSAIEENNVFTDESKIKKHTDN